LTSECTASTRAASRSSSPMPNDWPTRSSMPRTRASASSP